MATDYSYELKAAKIDRALKLDELLAAVEGDLLEVKRITADVCEEAALVWLMGDLGAMAFNQATFSVADEHLPDMSGPDMLSIIIQRAQGIWRTVIEYLKDTADIDMHPLAMLSTIWASMQANIDNGNDVELAKVVRDALAAEADRVICEVPKEFLGEETTSFPDIDDETNPDKLAQMFFETMGELGTFRRNKDEYETDEQREKHERLLALHRRIAALQK